MADFDRCEAPRKLSFSPDGRYLYTLPADLPIKLLLYRFNRPHPSIPNYHDHYELSYVRRGQGTYTIAGRGYAAREGDIFAIRGGVFHILEPADPPRMEVLSLYFAQEAVHSPGSADLNLEYLRLFHGTPSKPKILLTKESRAQLLESMGTIATELQDCRPFYRIAVKNALCDILLLLSRLRDTPSARSQVPSLALREANRLRPVFELIHLSFADKLKLCELAAAASIGPSSFCRYFKRVTGMTVMDYIRRYRIDQAKQLLLLTDRPVTWIAYESGFESHSHFDRVFRNITNLTPLEFRSRYAEKVPAGSDSTP